jgi:transcriptional regulator with XRE-family HTH domain
MEMLGERLKRLRKEADLTQVELAQKAGVSQATISGIESSGRAKQPATLIDIAHALGVDAYHLKTGRGKAKPSQLTEQESALLDDFRGLTPDQRIEYASAIALEAELNKARAKLGLPKTTDLRPTGT